MCANYEYDYFILREICYVTITPPRPMRSPIPLTKKSAQKRCEPMKEKKNEGDLSPTYIYTLHASSVWKLF